MPTHYEVLGVAPSATVGDIKKAYYKIARDNHPDKTRDLSERERAARAETFKAAGCAWEVLQDQTKRGAYDFKLREEAASAPAASRPSAARSASTWGPSGPNTYRSRPAPPPSTPKPAGRSKPASTFESKFNGQPPSGPGKFGGSFTPNFNGWKPSNSNGYRDTSANGYSKASSHEYGKAPMDDDCEAPMDDDREAPMEDEREAPMEDEREAPMEDEREAPMDDDRGAHMDDERDDTMHGYREDAQGGYGDVPMADSTEQPFTQHRENPPSGDQGFVWPENPQAPTPPAPTSSWNVERWPSYIAIVYSSSQGWDFSIGLANRFELVGQPKFTEPQKYGSTWPVAQEMEVCMELRVVIPYFREKDVSIEMRSSPHSDGVRPSSLFQDAAGKMHLRVTLKPRPGAPLGSEGKPLHWTFAFHCDHNRVAPVSSPLKVTHLLFSEEYPTEAFAGIGIFKEPGPENAMYELKKLYNGQFFLFDSASWPGPNLHCEQWFWGGKSFYAVRAVGWTPKPGNPFCGRQECDLSGQHTHADEPSTAEKLFGSHLFHG